VTLGSIVRKLFAGIVLVTAPINEYAPMMRTPAVCAQNAYAQEVAKASDLSKTDGDGELPVLKKNRISYDKIIEAIKKDPKGDKAGKYEQIKQQYLDQLLVEEFKLVYDKKRNPDGFVGEWFYWTDQKQRQKAITRIKDDLRFDGFGDRADNELRFIEQSLPESKIMPRVRSPPGQKKRSGYAIASTAIFNLENETEVFNTLDYVFALSHAYEFSTEIHGKKIDFENPLLDSVKPVIIFYLARASQLQKILKNERKNVSESFNSTITSEYLLAYGNYRTALEQRIADKQRGDNADVDMIKEERITLQNYLKEVEDEFLKLGYEHKCINEKEHEYSLVKISEKKDETPPKK